MKIIIFTDFDGTITKKDILDIIVSQIYSIDKQKEQEYKLINKETTYEKYLYDMFESITYNVDTLTKDLVDDSFFSFYSYLQDNKIDLYIVSSGFKKIIQHFLPYVNKNNIYANDINIEKGLWEIVFYDNVSKKSIDKLNVINNKMLDGYKSVFIGDGLSDFCVLGKVDFLFCKKDSILHKKCIQEKMHFIPFTNFKDILKTIQLFK